MAPQFRFPPQAMVPLELAGFLGEGVEELAKWSYKAFLSTGRHRRGCRLRRGKYTPLWNEIARQIRPYLRRYGDQVKLGRLLGLPRQQIHAYFIKRNRMPDAERALQFIVWLTAVRQGWRGPEWAGAVRAPFRVSAKGQRQPPVDMSAYDAKGSLDTELL